MTDKDLLTNALNCIIQAEQQISICRNHKIVTFNKLPYGSGEKLAGLIMSLEEICTRLEGSADVLRSFLQEI